MHKLLTDNPGQKMLLLGNEAIARGAIEAGLRFGATYPGTPSSEISLNLFQIARESELYFEYSVNEKVALEAAAAAANSRVRSICIMKHVGLNVAADALMTLAYVGVKGGMVVVTADDPALFSSQNEQDNRYYGKLSGLPVIEPSSVAEAKEMIPYAFDVSEILQEPVIFRTTTRLNHSSGVVELGEIKKPRSEGEYIKDPMNCVTVPAVARKLHEKLLKNIKKAEELSELSPYNFIKGEGTKGIVTSGVSYNYVVDALSDLGLVGEVKILRLGFSHPLPRKLISTFLKGCEKVLVVEEGEPYLEEGLKAIAQEGQLIVPIAGKGDGLFSRLYEFDPAMVRDKISRYFSIPYKKSLPPELEDLPPLPQRPPVLCPGCSHRAVFYAVKKAAEGMETICPTDIGCYTLGFLPPLMMGDFLLCMGSSVGTACGFSQVNKKKVIAFIGDSTFFHAGIPGLVNAVFNNHNFTLVILDNGTTAMTGHQPNPGTNMEELGLSGFGRVDIEAVVRALGVPMVAVIKPYNIRDAITKAKEAINFRGVSVIIARGLCTLYAKSLKKLKGRPFYISERCKNHRHCVNEIACPAFYIDDDRVRINQELCTGCSLCAQVCPEKAIVVAR